MLLILLTAAISVSMMNHAAADSFNNLAESPTEKLIKIDALSKLCILQQTNDSDQTLQYGLYTLAMIDSNKHSEQAAKLPSRIGRVCELKKYMAQAESLFSRALNQSKFIQHLISRY